MFTKVIHSQRHGLWNHAEFVCDAEADIASVPTDVAPGSKLFVIATKKVYILSNRGVWSVWTDNTGSGSSSGSTEGIENKTEKHLLSYNGSKVLENGAVLTYDQVYDMLMNSPDFVVLVYEDRAYHPNMVKDSQIVFTSSFVSNGYSRMDRISLLTNGNATITFGESESVSNKTQAITESNADSENKYPSVKAVYNFVSNAPYMAKRGKVVVFGDGLFGAHGTEYSFSDYIRSKGIYEDVIEHSNRYAGFSSDATLGYEHGHCLVQQLQDSQIRADVASADEIWLHLGINDVLYGTGITDKSNLKSAVEGCFATIKLLNPDVIIRYANSLPSVDKLVDAVGTAKLKDGDSEMSFAQILNILHGIEVIDLAIADAQLNILRTDMNYGDTIFAMTDGIHATSSAAIAWFETLCSAEWRGARKIPYLLIDDFNAVAPKLQLIREEKIAPGYKAIIVFDETMTVVPMHLTLGLSSAVFYAGGVPVKIVISDSAIEVKQLAAIVTQAEYDSTVIKDPETTYYIVEG